MKPVDQTILTVPGGNCFSACIASLLELPLDDVPNFCAVEGDWFKALTVWLATRGLFAVEVCLGSGSISRVPKGVHCIISGKSPRGDYFHSVIGRGAWGDGFELVHDPHPSRRFIKGEPTNVMFLMPREKDYRQ